MPRRTRPKTPALIALSIAMLGASPARGQTLGDFVLPSQQADPGAALRITDGSAVTITHNDALGIDVIAGADADTGVQDAINTARRLNLEHGGAGVRVIATPSGMGFVASARAAYDPAITSENLALLDQRRARTQARLLALGAVAEFLSDDGLRVQGRRALAAQQALIDADDAKSADTERRVDEELRSLASAVLRGAVTYTVDDDRARGLVTVTVVSTPRTQCAIGRVTADSVCAETLAAGLEAVFAEVKSLATPPIGGSVIAVPGTGEVAWVAYGSELVRENKDPRMAARTLDRAFRTAKLRADAALAELLTGARVRADSELRESFRPHERKLRAVFDDDDDRAFIEEQSAGLTRVVEQVIGDTITVESVAALQGVQRRSYRSDDGRWVWHVAVYFAPQAASARILGDSMQRRSPLRDGARRSRGFLVNPDGSFRLNAHGRPIPRSLGSGTVTPLDDL